MFISENLKVNHKNHLEFAGLDCVDLAKKYGTPLYLMDENLIRKNCKIYKDSINRYYNGKGLVLYAGKAFSTIYMCKIAKEEGLGLDVVSGGEIYTALKADFPVEKIYFHGNNKTYEELELAINNNIGRIVVDNIYELDMLNQLGQKKNKKIKALFRIKPGIEAHTHAYIKTGQIDSKFGVALENGEALNTIKYAITLSNIDVVGIHCHIGSQIFDVEPFIETAKLMMNFIVDLKNKLNLQIHELNLGGGFGIKYTEDQKPVPYPQYLKSVSEVVKEIAKRENINLPHILIEPGRSIVASAGITIYTVGAIKDIPGIRKYVCVDGGMTDNPRYILYQSEYDVILINNPLAPKTDKVTIAGKCCESGDILAENINLADVKSGDYIAVLATGGYNYSMSSNYNRIPKPPVVMIKDGQAKVIVKRESYEDIIRNDIY